jgi:hypothetical protein
MFRFRIKIYVIWKTITQYKTKALTPLHHKLEQLFEEEIETSSTNPETFRQIVLLLLDAFTRGKARKRILERTHSTDRGRIVERDIRKFL